MLYLQACERQGAGSARWGEEARMGRAMGLIYREDLIECKK